MEPVVVEFTKTSGEIRYEMGRTLDAVLRDTRCGCPVHRRDIATYKVIPLEEAQQLFKPETYAKAYASCTDTSGNNVFFLGKATYEKPN